MILSRCVIAAVCFRGAESGDFKTFAFEPVVKFGLEPPGNGAPTEVWSLEGADDGPALEFTFTMMVLSNRRMHTGL